MQVIQGARGICSHTDDQDWHDKTLALQRQQQRLPPCCLPPATQSLLSRCHSSCHLTRQSCCLVTAAGQLLQSAKATDQSLSACEWDRRSAALPGREVPCLCFPSVNSMQPLSQQRPTSRRHHLHSAGSTAAPSGVLGVRATQAEAGNSCSRDPDSEVSCLCLQLQAKT